jgi:4-diphosphocytidyl-2-C-methyl-D-erythritol kinase
MLEFPNAKINIGLNIIRKRTDGFHDLESLFYPIGMCDALEFIPASTPPGHSGFSFENTGIILTDPVEKNLCIKAYRLVKKKYPVPPLRIHLHKVIPPGSGLGGGSSNGAFMIRMLSGAFGFGITPPEMEEMAAELGSDCPFFIRNQPAFATGRGNNLMPVEPILSGYHVVVVHPGIHINTSEAYSKTIPEESGNRLFESLKLHIHEWKHTIRNDFEEHILGDYPEIGRLKEALYESGALFSSLSGSGSAVYGIFEKAVLLKGIPSTYFTWQGRL